MKAILVTTGAEMFLVCLKGQKSLLHIKEKKPWQKGGW